MHGTCPHCHEEIDLLEPKDMDELGLTPNVRGPAIESGDLQTWLRLRSGKFFLYLKEDVDDYLKRRSRNQVEKALNRAGFGHLSREEQIAQLRELEKALVESDTP